MEKSAIASKAAAPPGGCRHKEGVTGHLESAKMLQTQCPREISKPTYVYSRTYEVKP